MNEHPCHGTSIAWFSLTPWTRFIKLPILALALTCSAVALGGQEIGHFAALVQAGQSKLKAVQSFPSKGREHVASGTKIDYGTPYPTSGPHWPSPIDPGYYTKPQPPEGLVHSLEHGIIVIYYDHPGSAAETTLKRWAAHFTGPWSGLIATPHAGLGQRVVLTAWRHRLELPRFDPAASAAFIDRFRGRGPEHPVR
ncbi:MAG TPA: DUF3105 domain-containing protein [Nitrococcus sp.]|nr:DUF3105 domain-containing protein [Nitrococcus sp.]